MFSMLGKQHTNPKDLCGFVADQMTMILRWRYFRKKLPSFKEMHRFFFSMGA